MYRYIEKERDMWTWWKRDDCGDVACLINTAIGSLIGRPGMLCLRIDRVIGECFRILSRGTIVFA